MASLISFDRLSLDLSIVYGGFFPSTGDAIDISVAPIILIGFRWFFVNGGFFPSFW